MKAKLPHLWVLFILAFALNGCANIKPIAGFSTASKESLQQYETLPYGFAEFCWQNCIQEKIKALDFNADDCDCSAAARADSVTSVIYSGLEKYLSGLVALTGKNLSIYKTSGLTKALSTGEFGPIKIEKEQADAYSKISETILNAFATNYKKRKLKQYVTEANEPFQILINFLDFNLSQNLYNLLNNEKAMYRSNYFSLLRDTTLSAFEKREVMEDYYKKAAEINTHQNKLMTYSKSLKKIAEGHKKLAANINKMSNDDLRELLAAYTGDIQELISQFKTLKK